MTCQKQKSQLRVANALNSSRVDVLKTFINLYRNIYRQWYLLTATWPSVNSVESNQNEIRIISYSFTD